MVLTRELPQELTIAEAAGMLGVSAKTVRAYLADGSLVARDAAPLSSARKMIRIPIEAVTALRGSYVSMATEKAAHISKQRVRPWVPKLIKRIKPPN